MSFTTTQRIIADQAVSPEAVSKALKFLAERIDHFAFMDWMDTCALLVFGIAVVYNLYVDSRLINQLGGGNQALAAQTADLEEEVMELQGDKARVEAYRVRKAEREHRCAKLAENKEATSLLRRIYVFFSVENFVMALLLGAFLAFLLNADPY